MKKLILILALSILTTACSHTTINRVNRHQRIIVTKGIMIRSKFELYKMIKLKVRAHKCDKFILTELVAGSHAKGICINE